jgi:hypothetical protein
MGREHSIKVTFSDEEFARLDETPLRRRVLVRGPNSSAG